MSISRQDNKRRTAFHQASKPELAGHSSRIYCTEGQPNVLPLLENGVKNGRVKQQREDPVRDSERALPAYRGEGGFIVKNTVPRE